MNFFTKHNLEYTRGKQFFTYNDEVVHFKDIKEIDSKTTTEVKNSVYTQREMGVNLYFATGGLRMTATTKELDKYKLLGDLASDIERYKGVAPAGVPYEAFSKKESKYWLYFKVVFVLFGINGLSEIFFDMSLLRHAQFFKILSGISGILLGVMIVTTPMVLLVSKLNMRKFQREDDYLAGRESSVKDFNFSNVLLVILVAGLVYLIYKQVI
jgi:hypothetical protein